MAIRATEIVDILKQQIAGAQDQVTVYNVGTVVEVGGCGDWAADGPTGSDPVAVSNVDRLGGRDGEGGVRRRGLSKQAGPEDRRGDHGETAEDHHDGGRFTLQ